MEWEKWTLHEEVCGNKLELVRPLIDSYLLESGKSAKRKQMHSRATGFVNTTVLFLLWMVCPRKKLRLRSSLNKLVQGDYLAELDFPLRIKTKV